MHTLLQMWQWGWLWVFSTQQNLKKLMSKQHCVAGTPGQPCFQDLELYLKVDWQVFCQSLTWFFAAVGAKHCLQLCKHHRDHSCVIVITINCKILLIWHHCNRNWRMFEWHYHINLQDIWITSLLANLVAGQATSMQSILEDDWATSSQSIFENVQVASLQSNFKIVQVI